MTAMPLTITAIIVARDEEVIMPFALRHYAAFCDSIVVFDNQSQDRTREIVQACPMARLVAYNTGGVLRDDIHAQIKSEVYRNVGPYAVQPPLNGDWFIMVDADELVWHPDMRGFLRACTAEGITAPQVHGYEMVGDVQPEAGDPRQLWQIQPRGAGYWMYSKPCCIHRNCVVKYAAGCHAADFGGEVRRGTPAGTTAPMLLHYKWLSWPYVERKLRVLKLSNENRVNCWGLEGLDIARQKERYEELWAARQSLL